MLIWALLGPEGGAIGFEAAAELLKRAFDGDVRALVC